GALARRARLLRRGGRARPVVGRSVGTAIRVQLPQALSQAGSRLDESWHDDGAWFTGRARAAVQSAPLSGPVASFAGGSAYLRGEGTTQPSRHPGLRQALEITALVGLSATTAGVLQLEQLAVAAA